MKRHFTLPVSLIPCHPHIAVSMHESVTVLSVAHCWHALFFLFSILEGFLDTPMPQQPRAPKLVAKKDEDNVPKISNTHGRKSHRQAALPCLVAANEAGKGRPRCKQFFSDDELEILHEIVEKKKWLGQCISYRAITTKFFEKTGREITNL